MTDGVDVANTSAFLSLHVCQLDRILDATALTDGPVARIHLPQGIPDGFHGDWIPTSC